MVIPIAVALITTNATYAGVTVGGLVLCWAYTVAGYTIYGYRMFNREENNCGMVPETSTWNTMMIVFMIIGTFFVFYMSIITCMIPCIGIAVFVSTRNSRQARG